MELDRKPICWIACTMNTKAREAAFLKSELVLLGIDARIADISARHSLETDAISVSNLEIARAGGAELDQLAVCDSRIKVLEVMSAGLKNVLLERYRKNQLDAFVAIGGSGGMTLASETVCALPIGVPKMMVSTVVSGDVRPYIKGRDVLLLNPVADLAGLNVITRQALRTAARAIYGQLMSPPVRETLTADSIAVTSFGSTEGCVEGCVGMLTGKGYETTSFHARGISGGDVMEELIREGKFRGVLDVTTTEVTDLVGGGVYPCGPRRFEACADLGIPFVLAPGAIDMINLTPQAATESFCAGRLCIKHSANTILVRSNREENRKAAAFIAGKLNRVKGRYKVLLPLHGFSSYDREGGAFYDLETDGVFITELKQAIEHPEAIEELPLHINDADFARHAVETLLSIL